MCICIAFVRVSFFLARTSTHTHTHTFVNLLCGSQFACRWAFLSHFICAFFTVHLKCIKSVVCVFFNIRRRHYACTQRRRQRHASVIFAPLLLIYFGNAIFLGFQFHVCNQYEFPTAVMRKEVENCLPLS